MNLAHLKKRATNPITIVLVLSLVLVVLNVFLAQRVRSYTSDNVAWQTIFMTWHPFSGHVAYQGARDNFVVNTPLIWVLGKFFLPTRALLFVEVALFAVVNFVLFYVAGLYFLKKCKIELTFASLLPFVWLASFGAYFAGLFLNTSWRDFEMGVSFIYFMLAAKIYFDELDPLASRQSKVITSLVVLAAGLFVFSDPYFLYFTVVPIAGLFSVLYLQSKVSARKLSLVLVAAFASVVVARVALLVSVKSGLFTLQSVGFVLPTYNSIYGNIAAAVRSVLDIFGADFFGNKAASLAAIAAFANFVLIAYVAYCSWKSRNMGVAGKRGRVEPRVLFTALFGGVSVLVFVAQLVYDSVTPRYFVLMVYMFVLLLALQLPKLVRRVRLAFVGLIVVSVLLNVAMAIQTGVSAKGSNIANVDNYKIAQIVKRLGLSKGYAQYWDGNINTYASGGTIHFLPVQCSGKHTVALHLLVDDTLFKQRHAKTFYLFDPNQAAPRACSQKQLLAQFGRPARSVRVAGKTILVYNYDLVTKM